MIARRLAVCAVLVLATAVAGRLAASSSTKVVDVSRLPLAVGPWHGQDEPLDEDVVRQLGADSYINRTYVADGGTPVGMYVAFYAGQKPGDGIHSPLNCLPGTGWEPVAISTMAMPATSRAGTLRRMLVRKGEQQALVLYWYEVHGRALASEWDSKLFLLVDSIRLHRSDAAFVRVVVPAAADARAAEPRALSFTSAVMPSLDRLWSER